jgi:hypothetical protein
VNTQGREDAERLTADVIELALWPLRLPPSALAKSFGVIALFGPEPMRDFALAVLLELFE